MPGAYGTLDEIFELAVLIQTEKIKRFPVILIGHEFWEPLFDFLRERPLRAGTIDGQDLQLLELTDDIEATIERIADEAMKQFGLTYGKRLKPISWLGERLPRSRWRSSGGDSKTRESFE
jgi:predicted Rossmann-fold nucleotide-binding protein